MKIAMSSGHGKYISGAVGPSPWGLHEHTEAVRVVNQTADVLRAMGVQVVTFEDTTSHDQDTNLKTITDWHNRQTRNLDISIHFNSNGDTTAPRGTMCLYYSQKELAAEVASEIAIASGLKDLGPSQRTGLYFLAHTTEPAILIETCFVNSQADVDIYHAKFQQICTAIAEVVSGHATVPPDLPVTFQGRVSWFGGPDDTGVSPSEGLAFLYEVEDAPDLFLPTQPPGTTGLARRLDPETFYCAARWDYDVTPKEMLRDQDLKALVRAKGGECLCRPADWGPHEDTGRAMDLSPGLMDALGLSTDDEAELIYPAPNDQEPEPEPEPIPEVRISVTGKVDIYINGAKVEGVGSLYPRVK